jgi:hypothetical protein
MTNTVISRRVIARRRLGMRVAILVRADAGLRERHRPSIGRPDGFRFALRRTFMKKMILGTVSAFALLMAVHGVGNADTSSSSRVSDDNAVAVRVHNGNSTEDSFRGAEGAIQSQQNASINSAASENMSVTATAGRHGSARGDAETNSRVRDDDATWVSVSSRNSLRDDSFDHAAGAIQVQQNASVNSSVGQNTAISAAIGDFGHVANDADLRAQVSGNSAYAVAVTGPNTISDAFHAARGAISVQQNNSVNSSVSQQLSIVAAIGGR